jgi:hypothetical protein
LPIYALQMPIGGVIAVSQYLLLLTPERMARASKT